MKLSDSIGILPVKFAKENVTPIVVLGIILAVLIVVALVV